MKTSTEHSKTVFDSPPPFCTYWLWFPPPSLLYFSCMFSHLQGLGELYIGSVQVNRPQLNVSIPVIQRKRISKKTPTHISIAENLVKAQSLSILKLEAQHIDSIEPGSFRLQSEYPITRLHKVYTVSVLYLACTLFGGPWIFSYLAWIWFGGWLKSPFLAFIYRQSQM